MTDAGIIEDDDVARRSEPVSDLWLSLVHIRHEIIEEHKRKPSAPAKAPAHDAGLSCLLAALSPACSSQAADNRGSAAKWFRSHYRQSPAASRISLSTFSSRLRATASALALP
jgi:hypothetical protein